MYYFLSSSCWLLLALLARRIASVSSASLWSWTISSSMLENFSSGRVRFTKSKPDEFIIYIRVEVKDIHFNCSIRTIVNRRADTYI